MTLSTTNYDPTTTATQLAQAYTSGAQSLLDTQTKKAQSTSTGLTSLQSGLQAFDSVLSSLSTKAPLAMSATFGNPAIGTATASATATPGSYSFFVEQLASANQVAYSGLTSVPVAASDSMTVKVGGSSFNINLGLADKNGDGNLSASEIASAINAASNNNSLVTASVIAVGGTSQLVLTSNATGAASAISLDVSGVTAGSALQTSLANGNELVPAQDAKVWLGAQNSGVLLQQSSNTFTAVSGVNMTFTRAMANGDAPVTLTVARDDSATASNIQSFVDAYNKLKGVLDGLTNPGDTTNKVNAGAFANDSGVLALKDRLASILRMSVGGLSLISYGVSANRDGTLSLDQTRLTTKLNANPGGLSQLFGSTTIGQKSGVLGDLDTYLNTWTNASNGQISRRQDDVTKLQASLADRQTTVDTEYNNAYQRYLAQYTQLQALQSQLAQTSNMFDALFNSSKGS